MKKPEDEESQTNFMLEFQKYPNLSIRELWLFGKYATELWKRHGQRYGFRKFAGEGHSHSSLTKVIDTLEVASGKVLAEKGTTKAKKRTGHLTEAGNVWASFAHLVATAYELAMSDTLSDERKAHYLLDLAHQARHTGDYATLKRDWGYYSDRR